MEHSDFAFFIGRYSDFKVEISEIWEQKRFSDFAENLHIDSTPKVIIFVFGVKRENFLMGLKIDFWFEILGILVKIPYGVVALFLRSKKARSARSAFSSRVP